MLQSAGFMLSTIAAFGSSVYAHEACSTSSGASTEAALTTTRMQDSSSAENVMSITKAKGSMTDANGGPPAAPTVYGSSKCVDMHTMCATWASVGECALNPSYMHSQCPLSCQLCQTGSCKDAPGVQCDASVCYTSGDAELMMANCAWTCGMCNIRRGVPACKRAEGEVPALRSRTNAHLFPPLNDDDGGGASGDKGSCGTGVRVLPYPIETLDGMFERVVREFEGTVTVHSKDPWLISIPKFLSDDEASEILRVGGHNFQRSLAGDGVHEGRTSSTSWCARNCSVHSVIVDVERRIEDLTRIPRDNSEWMQVLRYLPGQFYKRHNDMNTPRSSPWGPRMLTAYMYLTDQEVPDAGGETSFPVLNASIAPTRGTLALWPSVRADDLFTREVRTDHETVSVRQGVKYGANLWIHMFDFRTLSSRGCENIEYLENWA